MRDQADVAGALYERADLFLGSRLGEEIELVGSSTQLGNPRDLRCLHGAHLDVQIDPVEEGEERAMDEETRRQLKALGYLD